MKRARCQHATPAGMEQLAPPGGIRLITETLHVEQAAALTIAATGGA